MRVAFVPRSAEIQPLFWRFVTFIPLLPHEVRGCIKICEVHVAQAGAIAMSEICFWSVRK